MIRVMGALMIYGWCSGRSDGKLESLCELQVSCINNSAYLDLDAWLVKASKIHLITMRE